MRSSVLVLTLFVGISTNVLGQQLRNFYLDDINGETTAYNEIKGEKLTVIDFWASWCKPCLKAMPKLEALRQKYSTQGVVLISINADGPRSIAKVAPLVKSLGLNSSILIDLDREVMSDLDIYQLPTLLIVNDQNNIVYRHEGYVEGDEQEVERHIKVLLAKHN